MFVEETNQREITQRDRYAIYHEPTNEYVSTQNVPRLWKGRSRGNIRTALDCISNPIQSERDLSLFRRFLHSRYSIKHSKGHISNREKNS